MSRGKTFESELKKSLESAGCLAHRIKDSVIWNGKAMVGQETPADLYFFSNVSGRFSASLVECKAESGKSISFDRVKQHQRDSLLAFDEYDRDCHGFVAINFYDKDNPRSFNVCYFVPIKTWVGLGESLDRKSLPISECENCFQIIKCPRTAGSKFDVSKLILSV